MLLAIETPALRNCPVSPYFFARELPRKDIEQSRQFSGPLPDHEFSE